MKLKGLLKVALVLLAISTMFVACDTLAGGKFPITDTVYAKLPDDWSAQKSFAVWAWPNGGAGEWLTVEKFGEDLLGCYIPAGYENVIFVSFNKEGDPNWDNKYAQTADLKIPLMGDTAVVYSVENGEWVGPTGDLPEVSKPKITYKVTDIEADFVGDNDVVVYIFGSEGKYLCEATYDDGTVTFATDKRFNTAIVITVPSGTDISGLKAEWSETEDNIWNYKINQTVDLTLGAGTTSVSVLVEYKVTDFESDFVGDNDVVAYIWKDDGSAGPYLCEATYKDGVVTFKTSKQFDKAIVVTVPKGTDISGLKAEWSDTEDNIWNHKINQTANLELGSGKTTVSLVAKPTEILITNSKGWTKMYVYYWGDDVTCDEWPGIELTEKTTNGYGEEQFKATIPVGVKGIIFNNGEDEKTVDIEFDSTKSGYYFDAKNDDGHWTVGSW